MFKVFAGAGVGVALVKEKLTFRNIDTIGVVAKTTNFKTNIKYKTNFAYQVSLGISFEVAQSMKAELVYSWRDYGITAKQKLSLMQMAIQQGLVEHAIDLIT